MNLSIVAMGIGIIFVCDPVLFYIINKREVSQKQHNTKQDDKEEITVKKEKVIPEGVKGGTRYEIIKPEKCDQYGNVKIDNLDSYQEAKIIYSDNNGGSNLNKVNINQTGNVVRNNFVIKRRK